MKITILVDNTVAAHNARSEHGLSFLIETGRNRLLFDTGQGFVLADNARVLNENLNTIDTVVLSHGHYDHTGGLTDVVRMSTGPITVHAHPDAVLPKYRLDEYGARDIGMPAQAHNTLFDRPRRFTPSRQPTEVAPGIMTTGEIPRLHPQEASTEPFYRDPEGHELDPLLDDQALFMESPYGTIVLLGCAHAGIINTLEHVSTLTCGTPIHAVLGGTHLRSATDARIHWTIQKLHRFKIDLLAPMHCTGEKSVAALWAAFPHACHETGVGSVFEF